MTNEKNLAVICDIRDNTPVGIICSCPYSGDIAFSTEDDMLDETLEVLLDNKVFLHSDEKVNNHVMISEDEIVAADSYYLMAINYSLPFPWRMLGVTKAKGDVEQIIEESKNILVRGE